MLVQKRTLLVDPHIALKDTSLFSKLALSYHIVAISHCTDAQRVAFLQGPLSSCIDAFYISADSGYEKQDREFYVYIQQKYTLQKGLIIDSDLSYLACAKQFGMKTIWFAVPGLVGRNVDFIIDDVQQLQRFL